MALTDTERAQAATDDTPPAIESRLGAWWVIAGLAVLLLVILGWKFMADPSISAPTRDPAWYTWRANVILQSNPVTVAQEWGPAGLFSGGYRITVPLAGALLQRVAGLDQYSFSAFLMIGVPVLTGLALGAGAFRSRRDPLAMLMTMIVSAALFLTTPYVGYLDNITVLFLLALTFPFLHAARTSWGARTALFLIAIAAAFTHPDDVRDLRRRAAGGVRLPFPDEPVLVRIGAPGGWPDADVRRVRDDRRPGHVGGRHLGQVREPRRRRAPAAVHEGVLRGPPARVGDVAAAVDHRPARDHRDRLDDPDGSPRTTSGAHVRPGVDLVDAAVPRNAHGAHRDRRPVLPVHERERGAHGARRTRLVRGDPLVPAARRTEAHRRRARGGRDPRVDRLGPERRPDEPMGQRAEPVGEPRACARRSPPSTRWWPTPVRVRASS